jgi:hypothetical protein
MFLGTDYLAPVTFRFLPLHCFGRQTVSKQGFLISSQVRMFAQTSDLFLAPSWGNNLNFFFVKFLI